jgi:F-type H+-transporting ATPase subunit b
MVSFRQLGQLKLRRTSIGSAQRELRPTHVPVPRRFALVALVAATLMLSAAALRAQEPAAHGEAGSASHEAAAHEESIWPFLGKIFNFAVLAGVLVYYLRTPTASYLVSRKTQVRADLETAERMKTEAAAQITELDAKLKALPAEIEALKARGRAEIEGEEQRIRELAAAEKTRLLDQATREIEQQVRVAHRGLVEHAATLAVSAAETRIKQQITDADQARLVDRYLTQVSRHD